MPNEHYSCQELLLSVEDVDKVIRNNLKFCKAAGADNITIVVTHLTRLFSAMIIHGYMPKQFGHSIIVPLVKDRSDDIISAS